MIQYIYLVPLFPLIGFIIAGLGRNVLGKTLLGWIPSLAVLASFIVSVLIFKDVQHFGEEAPAIVVPIYEFFKVGTFGVNFSFQVDQLSSLFLLIITGIGFLIHVYSISYMSHDAGFGKYFSYLNLFVFNMLLLVLGSNYIIMFIGWEGVGLCSYLLIGFWYKKTEYGNAAKKAFIMNRIGDLGFLIGVFLIISKFGTTEYGYVLDIKNQTGILADTPFILGLTLCLFIGACGKSAQVPLFTWLPDAMAGPTPVSALIHAATMVTAGIYMIVRSNILFTLAPITQHIILMVGLATALIAATIATKQNDIKKVLAYSTVSQLGFMFMAIGVGAYTTAVFHVITHAFFKALLFLGSGSVIHGMSGEQDIRSMGGLRSKMPQTYYTFLIGCIAIAGIPPLSGFFSKDEIMMHLFTHGTYGKLFWALGMVAAFLTAFYMFRLLFLTFWGKFRGAHDQEHHLHESPALMTIPLWVLAILSIVGGFIGLPEVFGVGEHWLKEWLMPVVKGSEFAKMTVEHLSHTGEYALMGIAVGVALLGIALAYNAFKNYDAKATNTGFGKLLEDKWMFDEAYNNAVIKPVYSTAATLKNSIEKNVIDGGVNGVGKLLDFASNKLRYLQSGMVGFYLFIMVAGIIGLAVLLFFIQ
jgi:NADH-quinone oxidoreductase subunit L